MTRTVKNDGAKYFGPYYSAGSAKETLDFIKNRFQIRQCKNFKYRDRPCLNYHIKRCLAPCASDEVSKEEYRKQISQIIMLLEGKIDNIIKLLTTEINEAAIAQEYEKAALLRDKKIAIERVSEKQKMANISENDIDVIGVAKNELLVCVEIFFVRNSRMIGREHYFFSNLIDEEDKEILSSFIKQYYMDKPYIPNRIMIKEAIEDKEVIEEWLAGKMKRKVEIKSPQKGEKLRFVEMAEKNAKITLENKVKDRTEILFELKEKLNLDKLPKKIETYDISNISGEFIVAGMCVAEDGVIKRNLSRRFKVKTVYSQDDPKCMQEVLTRRLKHSIETEKRTRIW